jgi:hypothetical protein
VDETSREWVEDKNVLDLGWNFMTTTHSGVQIMKPDEGDWEIAKKRC